MEKFKFKKNFGQNFLKDKNVINSILDESQIDKDTLVIEIGVGAAALTYPMSLRAKNVIGYEIDNSLENILENKNMKNVKIIFDDFLKRDIIEDIKNYEYNKLYLISNLPYYITTPIVEKIIKDKIPIEKMVIMVQKEVGDRFKAEINTKSYNSLTIYLKYYFDIKKIITVSRNCFIPKPNVDSIVLELKRKEKKYFVKNEDQFFKLVRDAFRFKRKNIKNNLKNYNLNVVEKVLKKYNFDLNTRAEALSIDIFIDMSNSLNLK